MCATTTETRPWVSAAVRTQLVPHASATSPRAHRARVATRAARYAVKADSGIAARINQEIVTPAGVRPPET
jgi:hypothetical protein